MLTLWQTSIIPMKLLRTILISVVSLLAVACGKDKFFIIECTIEGAGSQAVIATYYAAGGLKREFVAAVDGKAVVRGESAVPTLVIVTMSDGSPIAMLVAQDGDKIAFTTGIDDPLSIRYTDANEASGQIGQWIADNADALRRADAAAINDAVAAFVTKNPGKIASTALLTGYFQSEGYESQADSLFSIIDIKARPVEVVQGFNTVLSAQLSAGATAEMPVITLYDESDSTITVNPIRRSATLLCFLSDSPAGRDSVAMCLRSLMERYPKRLMAVEISCAPDSASWRHSIGSDTVAWSRTWLPASVASPEVVSLSVPRIPYFIVADSTRSQIYRGTSVANAESAIIRHLR